MKTKIIYGTNYGTSEKVSKILSNQIEGEVESFNIKGTMDINISDADNIIIGASIKIGQIQKELKKWLKENENIILKKKICIYLCAGEEDEAKREEFWSMNFSEEILKNAKVKVWVGGEINLEKMGIIAKMLVRIMSGNKESTSNLKIGEIKKISNFINN